MSPTRKAINFDLSTESLKNHFGENTAPAYNSIKKSMLDNGFEHRQYSGYTSIKPMSDKQVNLFARRLVNKFTWLKDCIQKFDVTDIGEQYDLTYLLTNKILQKNRAIPQLQDRVSLQDLNLQNKKRVSKRR